MTILLAAAALAAAQTAPAPVDHSQHSPAQHAQHQQGQQQGHAQHKGEHECCKEVNGKMECRMMKGHGAEKGQEDEHQGHSGH